MFTKKLLLIAGLVSFSAVSWGGSWSSGGGGNEIGLEFKALSEEAMSDIVNLHLEITPDHLKLLRDTLSRVEVISVTGLQEVSAGSQNQNVVAINFPGQNLIKVDANRWLGLGNRLAKKAIAIHELESLLGFEKTGVYDLSAKYLKQSGSSMDLEAELRRQLTLPAEFSTKPEIEQSECRTQDLTLDVSMKWNGKTGVNQNLASMLGLKWSDESKSYRITINKMKFVESVGKFSTVAQVKSIARNGDQPDSKVIDYEALNIVSLMSGKIIDQKKSTGEMFLKSLGENRTQSHIIQDGVTYSDNVATTRLNPDGTKVTTSENQLYPTKGAKYGVVSSSAICKETPNPKKPVVQFTPKLKQAIAKFSAMHSKVIDAKIALRLCQSDEKSKDCSALLKTYNALDQQRDQTWDELLLK